MQALRDAMSQIKNQNAVVLALSVDTVDSHKKFADQYALGFPLLSDTDKKATEAYGVLSPNGVAQRVTFIIDPHGNIRAIDRAVNAEFDRDGTTLTSRHGENLAAILSDWRARVGSLVPNFTLTAVDGRSVSISTPRTRGSVVFFLSKNCPVSQAYAGRIEQISANPTYKNVVFIGIDSNSNESAIDIMTDASDHHFTFPVVRDNGAALADHFGSTRTPEVWVINDKGLAVYHGAIDDNKDQGQTRVHYLESALTAITTGKSIPVPETRPSGCPIHRAAR